MRKVPPYFKSVLWSYSLDACDPTRMKKTIITQALLYGSFTHWKWIRAFYGDDEIRNVLSSVPASTFRSKLRPLVEAVFLFSDWNYA
ncbi:MAG: hypothetical protein UY70_C0005G0034 [Candidatus Kaiserbacteria bacterium GW2011_GWB1_52_6]|uniref:DUF6922 domain-containing protein n=3 Tax=Candidatus Kaiseribacteriota TaxID=1752734 RepID=A0A0G1ZUG7_9BACT|nr:MAG: hypothetical protein UY67_C0004G0029 [Candidatus Kaiserbacteria bacterium GW2011_GWA2_52_12]KKW27970.1 MAG: hypothetical protein UY70_C0005G0034 [Candidatus Kaiserbacteria bacterium GW2011_GWB1_52_6]KKW31987.1 MAG: hypothetical protein UY74_C0002G0023 [Candidatus Kaiserbacteria bacterium GW2011_GWC2_52_8b]